MKTIEELEAIKNIIGENHKIKIKEDGFISRGFVIDDGKLVFKFPRKSDVEYKTEIQNLNYINSLDLGVNLQKVAYESPNDEYLGIYGVLGNSLEEIKLTEAEEKEIGNQLGKFLKKLHYVKNKSEFKCSLDIEINAWQNRIVAINDFIVKTFSEDEQKIINKLMFDYVPKKLKELGENLVFAHGDLGDGNIFVDENGKVGVIDFNESGLFEEACDFMDIESEVVCVAMLSSYGADKTLIEKVKIRRNIRPLIVLKPYVERDDKKSIEHLVKKIRITLNEYSKML